MTDFLNAENIALSLSEKLKEKVLIKVFEKTDSTNSLVRSFAENGAEEGLFLVAGEQSAGRGRLGRSFYSPGDTGVYMSLLLRPEIKAAESVFITTAAAVAVCRALEECGAKAPEIKWVNDIFVGGKKVCGILTEASIDPSNNKLSYAVLGVGVNIYAPDSGFPEEIKNIAGAVFSERKENLRNKFCAAFLSEFFDVYNNGMSLKSHTDEYIQRSIVIGKQVSVISGDSVRSAFVDGITENCELKVTYENGEKGVVSSGEVSLKI